MVGINTFERGCTRDVARIPVGPREDCLDLGPDDGSACGSDVADDGASSMLPPCGDREGVAPPGQITFRGWTEAGT